MNTTTYAALIKTTTLTVLAASALLTACSDDSDDDTSQDNAQEQIEAQGDTQEQGLTCVAELMEEDAALDPRLGEMGDPGNWPTLPPTAIVASTYLRLQGSEASMRTFEEVSGPTTAALMAPAPGLMGLSVSFSESCGAVRTLSVWESEEAMMDFVLGEAHLNAMAKVGDISRGGSITDHWRVGDVAEVRWDSVVLGFTDHDGPVY